MFFFVYVYGVEIHGELYGCLFAGGAFGERLFVVYIHRLYLLGAIIWYSNRSTQTQCSLCLCLCVPCDSVCVRVFKWTSLLNDMTLFTEMCAMPMFSIVWIYVWHPMRNNAWGFVQNFIFECINRSTWRDWTNPWSGK